VRPETLPDYPHALSLERPSDNLSATANSAASLTDTVDVLWIATKTFQLDTALKAVQAVPRFVVPLLNGVDHIPNLNARFGQQRIFPATIAVEAEKFAPGRFIQRSPFVHLNLSTRAEPLLGDTVSHLAKIGFTCKFIENEPTLLWLKLCFLAPLALATSASGKNVGEVLADSAWENKLHPATSEACAIATASGAQVDAARIQSGFRALPPGMRSSMQKDVVAGRPLELDAIGGPIVRGGQRFDIDVPATAELMAMIKSRST